MLDLSLDVSNANTVKQALTAFTRVDRLQGGNKYKCEKCKKLVNASKTFSIDTAPFVLTVHLKRFTPSGRKLTQHIGFDEFLNLGPLMSDDNEVRSTAYHYSGRE